MALIHCGFDGTIIFHLKTFLNLALVMTRVKVSVILYGDIFHFGFYYSDVVRSGFCLCHGLWATGHSRFENKVKALM